MPLQHLFLHAHSSFAPPPEDSDVPDKKKLSALSSSSIPKSAASSVPPSPSNTIFSAMSVIPCAQISDKTADRATLRQALSALATRATYLSSQNGVPCPLPLETASEEFLPTKDNRSLQLRSCCSQSRSSRAQLHLPASASLPVVHRGSLFTIVSPLLWKTVHPASRIKRVDDKR